MIPIRHNSFISAMFEQQYVNSEVLTNNEGLKAGHNFFSKEAKDIGSSADLVRFQ